MPTRIMTWNIRNGVTDDGTNSWQVRKRLVARAIRTELPDVMGLQEGYWHQRRFLWEALAEYEQFGEHRDGGREGEATLICFRHEAFTLLEGGNVWLSDTPDVAGSRTWGNRNVRMASWARLRRRADGARLLLINCHLDHEVEEARQRGAMLLMDVADARAEGDPVVLLGDFNTWPDTPTHRLLTGRAPGRATRGAFHDAWEMAGSKPADQRTFHGWDEKGFVAQHARIDWILVRPRLEVRAVTRPAYREGDRLPSDHYPVIAAVEVG